MEAELRDDSVSGLAMTVSSVENCNGRGCSGLVERITDVRAMRGVMLVLNAAVHGAVAIHVLCDEAIKVVCASRSGCFGTLRAGNGSARP